MSTNKGKKDNSKNKELAPTNGGAKNLELSNEELNEVLDSVNKAFKTASKNEKGLHEKYVDARKEDHVGNRIFLQTKISEVDQELQKEDLPDDRRKELLEYRNSLYEKLEAENNGFNKDLIEETDKSRETHKNNWGTVTKIGGTLVAIALGVADFTFNEGRNVKKIGNTVIKPVKSLIHKS